MLGKGWDEVLSATILMVSFLSFSFCSSGCQDGALSPGDIIFRKYHPALKESQVNSVEGTLRLQQYVITA